MKEIIKHLYDQDIKGNVKTIPAMKKDIYFEMLCTEIDNDSADKIVAEINAEVDFRIARLEELKELFTSPNTEEKLTEFIG